MNVLLANPRGFCAGVDRAVEIVNQALVSIGKPIYVKHQVVHNKYVVADLEARGAIFIEDLNEVPKGATLIFSAHGVSQAVRQHAKERGFQIFDATCPLVTKVHHEVTRYDRHGVECVLIGHAGHPEVEGTMGQYHNTDGGIYLVQNEADVEKLQLKDPENVAYMTQTTLSVDDTGKIIECLRNKFPKIQGPKKDDICYATQNRQDAVKKLTEQCDVVLVVGSKASSNSNRLRELADRMGKPAYLIDQASDLQHTWFKETDVIGITAGASAPEILIKDIIAQLKAWGATDAQEISGVKEDIVFALPKELRQKKS